MRSSIASALSEAQELLAMCAHIYDARVTYTEGIYRERLASLNTHISDTLEVLDNLNSVSDQQSLVATDVVPVEITENRVFKAPMYMQGFDVISEVRHRRVLAPNRSYTFAYNDLPLTGTIINTNASLESSSRFSLSPSQESYPSIDVSVDWTTYELTLGDTVQCLVLDMNKAARSSGLQDSVSSRPLNFWSASQLMSLLDADIDTSRAEVTLEISSGAITSSQDVEYQDLIEIQGGLYFVTQDLSLASYVSTVAAHDLNGTYSASRIRTSLTLRGDEILLLDVPQSQGARYLHIDDSGLRPGDVVKQGGLEVGTVTNAGNGGTAEIAPSYAGGTIDIDSETHQRLSLTLGSIPALSLPDVPERLRTVEDFKVTSVAMASLINDLEDLDAELRDLTCPSDVTKVWQEIKSLHIKLGLDRALDLLTRANLVEYTNLDQASGSYAGHLSQLTEDLIIKVQQ